MGTSGHDWQIDRIARLELQRGEISLRPLNRTDQRNPGLVGAQAVKDRLLVCLAQHMAGLPTNHLLLYGPRGCGKSSLVYWAMAQMLDRGLCVIEADAGALAAGRELLLSQPDDRRFLVFLDDWGFDNPSSEAFRAFKSLLEGSLDALPERFLLCATANRRHLVAEHSPDLRTDEIYRVESEQERLALADRFGLWIRVAAPDQEAYLEQVRFWVESMAKQQGISALFDEPQMDWRRLEERAVAWATERGQRSGRVARQFATDLVSRYALLHKHKSRHLPAALAKRLDHRLER